MEEELKSLFNHYRSNFKTKTRDSSAHGWTVLKGYLLLETNRTYQNIDRKVNGIDADGNLSLRLPIGTHELIVRINDGCGNFNVVYKTFTVADCKKPAPICIPC